MNRNQRRMSEQSHQAASSVMRECMPDVYFREKVAVMDALQQNGITVKELEDNYNRGWNEGFAKAGEPVIQACYAAICLTLNDLYKFGSKRCADVLGAVDHHMLYSLTSEDAINEVYERMKLRINFAETFDRIQEVE